MGKYKNKGSKGDKSALKPSSSCNGTWKGNKYSSPTKTSK